MVFALLAQIALLIADRTVALQRALKAKAVLTVITAIFSEQLVAPLRLVVVLS